MELEEEHGVPGMNEVEFLLRALIPLIQFAFAGAVVVFVIVGAARIGWKFAPWIVGLAFLIYLFG